MKPERIEELMSRTPDAMCEEATDAELLHLLRCARAVAELEAYLHGDARRSITLNGLRVKGADSSLLTAIEAALAKAKAKEESRG